MNASLPPSFPPLAGEAAPHVLDSLKLRRGQPVRYLSNVLRILESDPRLAGRLRTNTLSQRIELVDDPTLDALVELRLFLETTYDFSPPDKLLLQALGRVAPPWNPLAAWLDRLEWDGAPRIDALFERYFGAEPGPLTAVYSRRFLISAIARARNPGAKVDTTPLLSGNQGLHKSSGVAALAPNPTWAASIQLDATSKDGMQVLIGKWLLELAELEDFGPATASRRKAFLTRSTDRYRASYGPRAQDWPRTCVFIATTNRDELFRDPTGARRYWPLHVTRAADVEAITRDRGQLFAEADVAYQAGEPWWLTAAEAAEHERLARDWSERDPWEGPLRTWVERRGAGFTTEGALATVLGIPVERQTRAHQTRVGRVLRQMGLVVRRPRGDGGGPRRRVYVSPDGVEGGGPG